MLSKPWLMSSGGKNEGALISMPSRSRTELAYSLRFSRCGTGLPGFGAARRNRVKRGFERRGKRFDAGRIGPSRTGRRHHPGSDLPNNLFPDGGVRMRLCDVERRQHEVALLQPVVVTSDAVFLDECLWG